MTKNSSKHIVVFHLLNDYSGSPMILKTVLNGLLKKGCKIDLVTSKGGVLDTIEQNGQLTYHYNNYNFSPKPLVTLLRYVCTQIYTFFLAFRFLFASNAVFYINTLLPVGPAFAGWLMRKKVVYHYHENADVKGVVYKCLSKAMGFIASEIICVSAHQRSTLQTQKDAKIVPNAVSDAFSQQLHPDSKRAFAAKNVLMACSAKMYKGVGEFIEIANKLPEYHFTLVLNCSPAEKDEFIADNKLVIPANMEVNSRTDKMYNYYNNASIVMNLSDVKLFVETFGMTVAESLLAGLPCIVPPVGASKEIIIEGENGFAIDSHDTDRIADKINYILSDEAVYTKMAESAVCRSKEFSEQHMVDSIYNLIVNGKN